MKRKIKLPLNKKHVHFSIDVSYEQQKKTTDLPTPTPSSSIKYIKLDLKPKSILKMTQTPLSKAFPLIQHPPLVQCSSYPSRNNNISSLLSAYSFQTTRIHQNALSPPSAQLKRPYKKARAINYNKAQTTNEKANTIKSCLLHHIRTHSTCTYVDYSSIILDK